MDAGSTNLEHQPIQEHSDEKEPGEQQDFA